MTFKGPVVPGPVKSREELEVGLSNGETTVQMLERLGFGCFLHYQKRRESWELGGWRIELDEPPHIGLFVEIEGPDAKTIRRVQAKLGLQEVPHTPASYARMLLVYCEEHNLSQRRLILSGEPQGR